MTELTDGKRKPTVTDDEKPIWEQVPFTWGRKTFLELVAKGLIWWDMDRDLPRQVMTRRGSRMIRFHEFATEYDLIQGSGKVNLRFGWEQMELTVLGHEWLAHFAERGNE